MALPIAHSCCGLVFGILRFVPKCCGLKEALQIAWTRRMELFICMLIANAPDIDFLFGICAGNLNLYHHMATHTLGWILAAAFCLWLYGRFALKSPPVLAFWFVFLVLAGHLVIDIFTATTKKPAGIMLAWPFSDRYWYSLVSIFPAPAKKDLADVFCLQNLKNVGWEFLISLPFVAAALLWKVYRPAKSEVPHGKSRGNLLHRSPESEAYRDTGQIFTEPSEAKNAIHSYPDVESGQGFPWPTRVASGRLAKEGEPMDTR